MVLNDRLEPIVENVHFDVRVREVVWNWHRLVCSGSWPLC